MKIGALFAGYGGLDLAVELALPGAEVAWVSEFDKAPSKILAHRYPDAPNHGDVTKIDWTQVEPVDVITGGSPCQDLSHAGKRAGMKAGTRSGLWASMCDAIDIIRPSLVFWENVRGALSAEATAGDVESCEFCVGDDGRPSLRALGRVLGDLAELGYDAAWCGLRAADVGAAHGRFRVFALAWPSAPDPAGDRRHQGRSEPARLIGRPDADERGVSDVVWGSREWRDLTLLKTPTSQLAVNGGSQHPDKRKAGGHGPTLADEIEHLLPTPRATDGTKGGPNQRGSSGDLMLPSAVTDLKESNDGNTNATRAPESVRGLWNTDGAEALQRQARGPGDVHPPEVLLDELREHADPGDEGCAPLAGAKAQGSGLRGVLDDGALARSSRRPEPGEQRPGEPADVVRVLSPAPALAGGPAEADGWRGEGCSDSAAAWGKYAPAVARWEMVLGRPAPDPTEPTGRGGTHRLSTRAVEWLMGLPDGWVTDPAIGISRNDQLKALGNGVCPQQCAEAIRHLLTAKAAVV